MISDSSMVMRAEVRRNGAAADAHGHPGKPEWTLVKDGTPCFVWSRTRQRQVDGRLTAEVDDIGAVFRSSADVQSGDRIEQVKDRRGRILFAGPFEVVTGTEKSDGSGVGHLAFKLRRIS